MGGIYVDNTMPTVHGNELTGSSRVPVDTALSGGASPQSGGMIPGTLPAPATQIGLTAAADGLKGDATQLGYGVNTVTTVAGAADSMLMPYAFPGAVVVLSNDGGNSTTIFGKGTDTIDGVATGTGNALADAARGVFYGTAGTGDGSDAGNWVSAKAAKIS